MTLTWPLLTLVGLLGWGGLGAWLVRRFGGVDLSPIGMCLAIGLALYLTMSGLAVAIDGFSTVLVTLFVATGIACALAGAAVSVRRSSRAGIRRVVPVGAVGAALIATVLMLALSRTASFVWNVSDDDVAYLYLARRLTVVGNLLEPLNFRRLTSLGGASALQAMFLGRLPDIFLPFADAFFGSLLILLALWRTRLGRWSVWGIAAGFAVILFPSSLGDGINTSPIYLPVGLTIVIFSVALRMRTEVTTARGHLVCSIALGLLAASVVVLRPQFGPPVVILALVAAAWPAPNSRVAARLTGVLAGLTALLAPWAVASWRAVGTPLFPLLNGNFDPLWASGGGAATPAPSLVEVASHAAEALGGSARGIAFLLTAAIALVLYFRLRRRIPADAVWAMRLWCVVALASLLVLAALAYAWYPLGSPLTYARFWAPSVIASILIPLVAINGRRTAGRRSLGLLSAAVLGAVVIATGANPVIAGQNVITTAKDTATGQLAHHLSPDHYAPERSDYAQAAALIPRGSSVLAAVDFPSLLLEAGLDVHTLDIPGSTSPVPHLPYFAGSAEKLSWMRANGYEYIIAMNPDASAGLYNRAQWQLNVREGGQYEGWASHFVDWFDFIDDMSHSARSMPVAVPQLIVLKL